MTPVLKPKLLIFINSLEFGGAERVVSLLLNHLNDEFEIHLAMYSNKIDYEIPKNIPIFDLGQPLNAGHTSVFLNLPALSYRLHRYCKTNQIKTSVAFLNRPCYINALMRTLWRFKGKIVMCERTHQSTILAPNSRIYRMVTRRMVSFAYKRADLVLVNSFASKQDLQENFHVKKTLQVIYNPVNIVKIHEQAEAPCDVEFDKNYFHFISVGGFRKEKNINFLLDAFFIIKDLPVKLILVGSGSLHKDLENKVEELGMRRQVIFTGYDNNPFKYVKRSQCFVLSSYVEGFPNVLLEALACEKPVISTDCKSGPRELLAPGTDLHHSAITSYEIAEYGILTPVNDVANLAASMKKMYEDKSLRKGYEEKAMSRAGQFNVDKIIRYFHVAFLG